MSRVLNLKIDEATAIAHCQAAKVGISALENLPEGGVRLVAQSVDGAERLRKKLKSHLLAGEVRRARYRPLRSYS